MYGRTIHWPDWYRKLIMDLCLQCLLRSGMVSLSQEEKKCRELLNLLILFNAFFLS